LVVPPLLGAPPGPILEIGTLYGLFSPALVRSFRRAGQFRELTVVDPFAGDQVQGGRSTWEDPSGTPVVEQVVRRNMVEFGLTDPGLPPRHRLLHRRRRPLGRRRPHLLRRDHRR
jgi:hypothetical protein